MCKAKKVLGICLAAALCVPVSWAYAAGNTGGSGAGETVEFVVPDSSALDVTSCRYTQAEEDDRKAENRLSDLTGFEKKLESQGLAVYYSEETKGIRILNKETGYVWGGLPQAKPEDMNETWSAMANSILTIDYLNVNCQSNRASLGSSGTEAVFTWGEQEASCDVTFGAAGISLSFTMELSEDSLTIEVQRDSLRETGEFKLQSVWILPFLGTVREDETPGYILIPDGSGALIRYNKAGTYTSVYDERIYGKDVSVDELSVAGDLVAKRNNDYLTDTPGITMPVYGAVHGVDQNAYLAVVEEGAEHASVYASPAGMITAYNWGGARFDYRQAYSYPVNQSGKTIMTTQEEPLDFDSRITFYFMEQEEANYSAMAVRYRELLEESGALSGTERVDTQMPLYLHVMAGTVREGILFNGYNRLTTTEEAAGIVEDLKEGGITNLSVSYEGWQKGGIGGGKYGSAKADTGLGGESGLADLQTAVSENGGRFYLYVDPVSFNEDQARTASTAALSISRSYSAYTRSNLSLMYPTEYYAHPVRAAETLGELSEKYADYALDVANLGNMIYGDYSRNDPVTRLQSQELFLQALEEVNTELLLETPNQYLWNQAGEYTNIPLKNSQYLFETDSVPFLQIVLKGSVDYYASYANQGFYNQTNRLKMVEYGAYPSFIVMAADNEMLIDTPLEDYFSLNYGDWSEVIREVCDYVGGALQEVEGSRIQAHEMLDTGVARVTYDNGKTIYVNYLNQEYVTEQGLVIPASDYLVADR